MDVWKQDSLHIKASQEHSRITRGMSWTDASWDGTAAEPGLLGIHIASAVTQAPAMQMLLCQPILKAVFICWKCVKVLLVFSQRVHQQRAKPLLLCVFSCCYWNELLLPDLNLQNRLCVDVVMVLCLCCHPKYFCIFIEEQILIVNKNKYSCTQIGFIIDDY